MAKYRKNGKMNKSYAKGSARTPAQKKASAKRKGKKIRYVQSNIHVW